MGKKCLKIMDETELQSGVIYTETVFYAECPHCQSSTQFDMLADGNIVKCFQRSK